ncbi:hypothetical protein COO91_05252 [Nostoc flagelliforme CCNUN1]|uniref:Uncharacterized protein n=1 Tax=Nostoc flagelliforme CCNUN1 TaxID=2038116 RepID=A0A2K8SV97_9NOSO|nr:hypothetical protein COO91_05252 [Nostoc flagelliforme CCNUN1]
MPAAGVAIANGIRKGRVRHRREMRQRPRQATQLPVKYEI